jgi:hypothetical protein
MKIEGYSGICACCFEPIKTGEEAQIRVGGRNFHKRCIKERPGTYYVKLETRNAIRQAKKEVLIKEG